MHVKVNSIIMSHYEALECIVEYGKGKVKKFGISYFLYLSHIDIHIHTERETERERERERERDTHIHTQRDRDRDRDRDRERDRDRDRDRDRYILVRQTESLRHLDAPSSLHTVFRHALSAIIYC